MRFIRRSRPSRQLVQALSQVSAWAFDWDGTLLDSIGRTMATYQVIFGELDIPFDRATFRKHYSPDWRQMYVRLGVPRDQWGHIDQRWIEIYESEVSNLVPGAAETLAWLKSRGCRLALITAGHRDRVEMELRANDLVATFDVTVFGNEVPHQKPDPAPMVLASRYLRVEPTDVVLVGDSAEDMTMAKRAGALPVGVLSGAASGKKLRSAGARWVAADVVTLLAPLREVP
jgi:HAD superfamily hydrolase (TIGR01509 family)